MTLPETFCGLTYAENAIAAGAPPWTPLRELTALPRPPNRLGSGHPYPHPTWRLWRLDARAFGASIVVPPDTKSWRRHWSPPLFQVKLRQCRQRKCADTTGTVLVLCMGWPFPMLKYKYIFFSNMEAILSKKHSKTAMV